MYKMIRYKKTIGNSVLQTKKLYAKCKHTRYVQFIQTEIL